MNDQDFEQLTDEFIRIAEKDINDIYKRRASYTDDEPEVEEIENVRNAKMSEYRSKIQNEVGILKEDLRLKITAPSGISIHVGGDVAVINTGTVYGSVSGQIEKLRETSTSELVDIFEKLLNAVRESNISEDTKLKQMQNVDFLVTQYSSPPQERNLGLISASLTLLSFAVNLATIWGQFGPMIIDAFK